MATSVARGGLGSPARKIRIGWRLGGISALALAAVVVAAIAFLTQASPSDSIGTVSVKPLYTPDQLTVIRLVEDGVLPGSVLAAEPFRTGQLVNEGLVPRGALDAQSAPVAPLYCPKEKAIAAGVAHGVVPDEVLGGEPFRTKRLINQGLIPREAAAPC